MTGKIAVHHIIVYCKFENNGKRPLYEDIPTLMILNTRRIPIVSNTFHSPKVIVPDFKYVNRSLTPTRPPLFSPIAKRKPMFCSLSQPTNEGTIIVVVRKCLVYFIRVVKMGWERRSSHANFSIILAAASSKSVGSTLYSADIV